jgi:hypothetical protein
MLFFTGAPFIATSGGPPTVRLSPAAEGKGEGAPSADQQPPESAAPPLLQRNVTSLAPADEKEQGPPSDSAAVAHHQKRSLFPQSKLRSDAPIYVSGIVIIQGNIRTWGIISRPPGIICHPPPSPSVTPLEGTPSDRDLSNDSSFVEIGSVV